MNVISTTRQLETFAREDAARHYDAIRCDGQAEARRQGRSSTTLEYAFHLAETMRALYRNESFRKMFG